MTEANLNELEFSETEDSSELFEHYKIIVDAGQSSERIDKFLTAKIQNVTRTKVQAAAEAGCILVNQREVKSNYRIKPNDVIRIMLSFPPENKELIPENIPLNIVYEDDELLVVNKPARMVVHPAHGNYTGTLVNALAWHLKDSPLFTSGDNRPGLVHRIDKNTSGLLVIAKTEFSKFHLAKQFMDKTSERVYHALVWGNFEENSATISGNISRHPKNRKIMDVYLDENIGKPAITHYKVIERFLYVSLIECRLETGRTHQIRVHMQHIGHPVFADEEYGGNQIVKGTTFSKYKQFVENCFSILNRQALHAKTLAFEHPVLRKRLAFDSELPDDMQNVIEKWRNYSNTH